MKKRIIFSVTNNIRQDQRMQRIAGTLVSHFDVLIVGRGTPSPEFSRSTFSQSWINCFFKKGKTMYLEFNLRLFFLLVFNRVNIIGAIDPDTLLACSCAAWIKRVPLVYDAHELFTELPELQGRRISQKVWSWIEKFGVGISELRYTVNDSVARELELRYGKTFQVIRNCPAALPYPIERDRSTCRMIWYQGVLNVGRGLEEMIDAIGLLPDEWRFEMAGEGDIKPFLMEKVASLGLANRVLFHGHLNRVEMASRSADAFAGINLLRSGSKNYYLSLANKYFDYVQQGIPQLCMNFPEYSRLQAVFPVAVLLDGIEPSKIADHILKLAADSMAYHELQLAIMKARQEWIWENEEIKLLDLYKSIPS